MNLGGQSHSALMHVVSFPTHHSKHWPLCSGLLVPVMQARVYGHYRFAQGPGRFGYSENLQVSPPLGAGGPIATSRRPWWPCARMGV